MKSRRVPAVLQSFSFWLLAALAGVIGGLISVFAVPGTSAGPPVAELPAVLDVGEREMGEIAVVPFFIGNRGGQKLVIENVRTTCSCSGIERQEGGKFYRIERLEVNPGERIELVMRVAMRGVPAGAGTRIVVRLCTNDPAAPDARIEVVAARVSAGVHAAPNSVAFGSVGVHEKVRKVVFIRDTAIPPRTVDHVSSTLPERVSARLLPDGEWPADMGPQERSSVIACVEVLVDTGQPGDVNAKVHIHLAGEQRQPDEIAVFGTVEPAVEIFPAVVLLPRETSDGPVHSAECLCKSRVGQPIQISVEKAPSGLTVEIEEIAGSSTAVVRVTMETRPGSANLPMRRREIELRAKVAGREFPLRLTVFSP